MSFARQEADICDTFEVGSLEAAMRRRDAVPHLHAKLRDCVDMMGVGGTQVQCNARSAGLPLFLIGSQINCADHSIGSSINLADHLIGSPITWHHTACAGHRAVATSLYELTSGAAVLSRGRGRTRRKLCGSWKWR